MVAPSSSKKARRVRTRKKVNGGKKRKRALRIKGSTPSFPIHKEEKSSGQPSK